MSALVIPPAGISEARALSVQRAATTLLNGFDALETVGGWEDGDTIPAITVRWFIDKFREDARACLRASDQCEPEPGAQL